MCLNKIIIKGLFFFIAFLSTNAFSQSILKGEVKNESSIGIPFVNIVIKTENDRSTVVYTSSDENGNYELTINKTGNFIVTFSALSYESISYPIAFLEKDKLVKKDVTLNRKTLELKEVVIKSERPISVKKDTITYNVKSFALGNEQVVEDLLKRLPGISISSDGVIKVGNQEIEKVMIEGDDFFEKGYKIVTKNMPASPVEKVELYQNYSNNKHLKGIENSNKVALNLKLKDDAKRQWFGNMKVGYGFASENRYELRSNLMNFGKKNKYYFLTNLNNIGDDATGNLDQLIQTYNSNESESLGDNESAYSFISLDSETPNLKQRRVNFNNAEMLSLNSIFNLNQKTKLKTLSFFNADENDFFRNSFQSFVIGNTNFENSEDFKGRKTMITGFGKIDLTHDLSKTKTIEYTGKFNSTHKKNTSDINFNGNLLNEKLQSNNELFDQKIVFTNKFRSNKVLLFSGRYIHEKTPQNYAANRFIYQDLFNQDANNIIQTSENSMQFAGFNTHLLDRKKNGDLLELEAGNKFRKDNLVSNFLLIDDNNTIEPSDYQNKFLYISNDFYFSAKYILKFKITNFLIQSDFHQLFNKLENYSNIKSQNPFFINPKIGFEWEMNKKNKLLTSYSFNTTNATILNTYTNNIHAGFRSFSRGSGNFNQLDSSTALLNYTYGNWGDKFFANTFIMYTKNHDFFSTNTLVSQNSSQSEVITIKNREFLTVSSNIDRFFKSISSNLKLTFGATKSNYKNIVNDSDLREVKNNSIDYGFELRSGFKGVFNYHIGSKWNYSQVKTTINNSFTNNMTFLDLNFILNEKLNFQIQTERYYFSNLEKRHNKYYFMDFEALYTVKENKLIFSISGNNLFNTKTFKNYNINDVSISITEYQLQPRYLLLKIEFKF